MSAELVVLCGLAGSGKSTWRREHLAATHVVVSKDLMRSRSGKEARQQREIRAALGAGRAVVVDNTNLTREVRAALLALAREFGVPARAVVVHVPVELALERNAQREGPARVPDGIVRQMAALWEEPVVDEGFDSVEFVEQEPAVEVM